MARLRFALSTTAEVALTTSLKTVVQIGAPANQRVAVRGFGIAFDGVSSTAGCAEVLLVIQTTGTQSGTSLVGVKDLRGTTEAIGSTGLQNFSAEPTYSDILRSYNINQMTGYERAFAQDEEIELAGGTRLGVVVRASSAVNAQAFLSAEE
jgi:hypothetical protein